MAQMSGYCGDQMRQFPCPTRYSFLAALLGTLAVASILTACENGLDDNTPATTPTTTITPTATVNVEADEGADPPLTASETASLSPPSAGSEELFVISRESESIRLVLKAGDTFAVSYHTVALSLSQGYPRNPPGPEAFASAIKFAVLDPSDRPLIEVDAREQNSVEVQVETTGNHQLVFTHPYLATSFQSVTVEYAINP